MSDQGAEIVQEWCRREGIAGGEWWGVCVCVGGGAAGCTGEGEWVRCGEEGKVVVVGGGALVSCSPNSQLLSAEQVHKASLEEFGEGRQDET